jgi:hypothetical protein
MELAPAQPPPPMRIDETAAEDCFLSRVLIVPGRMVSLKLIILQGRMSTSDTSHTSGCIALPEAVACCLSLRQHKVGLRSSVLNSKLFITDLGPAFQ